MGRPTACPSRRRQPKDSFIPAPTPVKFHQQQFPRDSDADGGRRATTPTPHEVRRLQGPPIPAIGDFQHQHVPLISKLSYLVQTRDHSFRKSHPWNLKVPALPHRLPLLLETRRRSPRSPQTPQLPFQAQQIRPQIPRCASPVAFPPRPHPLARSARFLQHPPLRFYLQSVSSLIQDNLVHQYTLTTYLHYIRGEDDAVEDLDHKFTEKLEQAKKLTEGKLEASQDELKSLRSDLERLRSQPLGKEELEKNKGMLEDKVKNLSCGIEDDWRNIEEAKKVLAEKERLLEVKDQENCRLCKENEELKRTVEAQPLNTRDVERMKRELKALKTDIGAAEVGRNDLEEKCWELDTTLTDKFKDLEALALDCNLELRRLKIGDGIQYQLNPMGTTPAEIMGFDYKLTLKPALNSFAEDIKKSSMSRWEELLSYQQKSNENAVRFEGKRNRLGLVQSRVDQIEAQWNMTKKETVDYTSRCFAEAKQMLEDVQVASHDLDVMEREAAKVRKDTESKLQQATKQSEEEIQMRARELFKLVHSVSKYKEHVVSKISETKRDLSETASVVSEAYRGSFPVEFSNILNANCQL